MISIAAIAVIAKKVNSGIFEDAVSGEIEEGCSIEVINETHANTDVQSIKKTPHKVDDNAFKALGESALSGESSDTSGGDGETFFVQGNQVKHPVGTQWYMVRWACNVTDAQNGFMQPARG